MGISILVPLNDSMSSKSVVDFLIDFPFSHDEISISLIHVFRKPSSGEELMGGKFMEEQPDKYMQVLENARDRLLENGFNSDKIRLEIVSDPYSTVTDGIIDLFQKGNYNLIVIGRKKMSKAEEFVLGDPSIKLVRILEDTAVMVIKSQ